MSTPDVLYGDGVADVMRELGVAAVDALDPAWAREWFDAIVGVSAALTTAEFNVFMERLTPRSGGGGVVPGRRRDARCPCCGGVPHEIPLVACGECGRAFVPRVDGRPRAHLRGGERCPGGGAAGVSEVRLGIESEG